MTSLTKKDYIKILDYYDLPVPRKHSQIKTKAEQILRIFESAKIVAKWCFATFMVLPNSEQIPLKISLSLHLGARFSLDLEANTWSTHASTKNEA